MLTEQSTDYRQMDEVDLVKHLPISHIQQTHLMMDVECFTLILALFSCPFVFFFLLTVPGRWDLKSFLP